MAFIRSAALAALFIFAGASPLTAGGTSVSGDSASLSLGPVSPTPRGYYELCRRDGRLCRPTKSRGVATTKAGAVVLTSSQRKHLDIVNASVNRGMRPQTDNDQYGVADRWAADAPAGDCEDFALAKRMKLIRAGWPSAAALIALARAQTGEEHAVLIVRTDLGDLVLDNLTDEIRVWKNAPLRLTSIQSPDNAWTWRKL